MIVPGVTGVFGSFNFRPPHPGDLTGSDQFPACVQEAIAQSLSLLIHSHREALSANRSSTAHLSVKQSFSPDSFTLTPLQSFYPLVCRVTQACGMRTLASAGIVCLAVRVTNHCVTVDINLWRDGRIYSCSCTTWLCARHTPHLDVFYYLVFQNVFIFSEGEHLYREALDVGWDQNSGVARNGMKDCHIVVVGILTASEENIKGCYNASKS